MIGLITPALALALAQSGVGNRLEFTQRGDGLGLVDAAGAPATLVQTGGMSLIVTQTGPLAPSIFQTGPAGLGNQ